jgi:hypothetical protein
MSAPKCVAPKRINPEDGESRYYKYPDEHDQSSRVLFSDHALTKGA